MYNIRTNGCSTWQVGMVEDLRLHLELTADDLQLDLDSKKTALPAATIIYTLLSLHHCTGFLSCGEPLSTGNSISLSV